MLLCIYLFIIMCDVFVGVQSNLFLLFDLFIVLYLKVIDMLTFKKPGWFYWTFL